MCGAIIAYLRRIPQHAKVAMSCKHNSFFENPTTRSGKEITKSTKEKLVFSLCSFVT
jgi:hypothetical protein